MHELNSSSRARTVHVACVRVESSEGRMSSEDSSRGKDRGSGLGDYRLIASKPGLQSALVFLAYSKGIPVSLYVHSHVMYG